MMIFQKRIRKFTKILLRMKTRNCNYFFFTLPITFKALFEIAVFFAQLFYPLRPFHKTYPVSEEILLIAYGIHLIRVSYPVHVKMGKGQSPTLILMYDGKGRARDIVFYAKALCKALCKYGLPCSQVSGKEVYLSGSSIFPELHPCAEGILRASAFYSPHIICCHIIPVFKSRCNLRLHRFYLKI